MSVLGGYKSVIVSQEGMKTQLLFPIRGVCAWQDCASPLGSPTIVRMANEVGMKGRLRKRALGEAVPREQRWELQDVYGNQR